MNTQSLIDLLLLPYNPQVREALGASWDLVCVPMAEEKAARVAAEITAERWLSWHDPQTGRWLCSLHSTENCRVCK